jgi:tetratricopeptide (TPR) repeat protein
VRPRNAVSMQRAFRMTHHHPSARKALELLRGDEISRDTSIYGSRVDNEVLAFLLWKRIIAFPSGLLIPLELLGILLVIARSHRGGLGRRHVLVLAALISQAAFVLAFFVTTRYRLPLIVVAIPYAAYAVATSVEAIRSRGSVSRAQSGLIVALGLALFVLCNVGLSPMPAAHEPFELEYLGSVLAARGLSTQAVQQWQRAIALDPRYAPSHFQLGRYFLRSGELARADAHFIAGLRVAPNAWPARLELARVLEQQERRAEAADQIRRALTDVPSSRQRLWICLEARRQGLDVQAGCR